jgi:hypothetical protein
MCGEVQSRIRWSTRMRRRARASGRCRRLAPTDEGAEQARVAGARSASRRCCRRARGAAWARSHVACREHGLAEPLRGQSSAPTSTCPLTRTGSARASAPVGRSGEDPGTSRIAVLALPKLLRPARHVFVRVVRGGDAMRFGADDLERAPVPCTAKRSSMRIRSARALRRRCPDGTGPLLVELAEKQRASRAGRPRAGAGAHAPVRLPGRAAQLRRVPDSGDLGRLAADRPRQARCGPTTDVGDGERRDRRFGGVLPTRGVVRRASSAERSCRVFAC